MKEMIISGEIFNIIYPLFVDVLIFLGVVIIRDKTREDFLNKKNIKILKQVIVAAECFFWICMILPLGLVFNIDPGLKYMYDYSPFKMFIKSFVNIIIIFVPPFIISGLNNNIFYNWTINPYYENHLTKTFFSALKSVVIAYILILFVSILFKWIVFVFCGM